jgi:hypothetical protein
MLLLYAAICQEPITTTEMEWPSEAMIVTSCFMLAFCEGTARAIWPDLLQENPTFPNAVLNLTLEID